MTGNDALRLRCLIENHRHYTNSERAKTILENWDVYLPKFVKVMPVEYRRALQELKQTAIPETSYGNGSSEMKVALSQ